MSKVNLAVHYFRTSPQSTKAKGEALLSIKLADYLRKMTLSGKCKATWTKIAHETFDKPKIIRSKSGKISKISLSGNLLRNMGKLAGVADFIFTWDNHLLWLELKVAKGKQSEDQLFFQKWCESTGSPYEVAYSFKDAVEILTKYGVV